MTSNANKMEKVDSYVATHHLVEVLYEVDVDLLARFGFQEFADDLG